MTLRIRQYVYLAVYSNRMPEAEMSRAIGLEADTAVIHGSRSEDPQPIPRSHAWKVICNERGLRVDEQLERLVGRLAPYQAAIRALCQELAAKEGGARASLNVVRYFDDRDGEADGYQHRLLGWHLSDAVLQFVVDLGAEIDVDEYGRDLP